MKLYHYAPTRNTVSTDGIKSFAKYPKNLRAYSRRAGSEKTTDIIKWLDGTFSGRSRAISVLTEPIKPGCTDRTLKYMQKNSVLFSIELDDLIRDNLVESIWCKDGVIPAKYIRPARQKFNLFSWIKNLFHKVSPEQIAREKR